MQKKVVIALPRQSTYYSCLTRAFDYLGWEHHFFDFRQFTVAEKTLATVFNNRKLATQLLNSRFRAFVSKINPSWLCVLKGETLHPESLAFVRKKGIITVNWFPDGLWRKDHILQVVNDYDFFLHFDSLASDYLQKKGFKNVSYLPYAADLLPSDPEPVYGSSRIYPLSFIGNHFPPREKLFRRISSQGLFLWGDKSWQTSSLAKNYQGVCPFGEVNKILSKTKISVNLHFDKKSNGANLRVFETARAGTCLLTDYKKDVASLYTLGEEVIVYKNSTDFENKVAYLLQNPDLTQNVGMKSFQRTKREHTYVHRLRAILNTIR